MMIKIEDNKQYLNIPSKVFVSNGRILLIMSGDKIKLPHNNESSNAIIS